MTTLGDGRFGNKQPCTGEFQRRRKPNMHSSMDFNLSLLVTPRINEAEAGFRSLTEAIDTTTAPGRMMMQMVGAFAEFERAILRERTKAGLDAARKHGRIGGRRPKLRPNQQDELATMVSTGAKTAADAARLFNVHPATVSRMLAKAGVRTLRAVV
jgi:DNA invertase Pin-like site-specific DNA recombinase